MGHFRLNNFSQNDPKLSKFLIISSGVNDEPEESEEEEEEEDEEPEVPEPEPEPVKEPARPVRQRKFKWDIHDD